MYHNKGAGDVCSHSNESSSRRDQQKDIVPSKKVVVTSMARRQHNFKNNADVIVDPKEISSLATKVVKVATPAQDSTCTSKSVDVNERMNTSVAHDVANIVGKEKPPSWAIAKGSNKNSWSRHNSE